MPCYDPPPTEAMINDWKQEAWRKGQYARWYDLLSKEEVMRMLCDVINGRTHPHIEMAYAIHSQREKR